MATREEFVQQMMNYDVINPVITYDGDILFQGEFSKNYYPNRDILMLNSKIDSNGNNMYEVFMNNNFIEPVLLHQIQGLPDGLIFPLLYCGLRKDGKGRELKYTYLPTIFKLTENMKDTFDVLELFEVDKSNSNDAVIAACDKAREWYKSVIKGLRDFRNNRLDSASAKEVLIRFAHDRAFRALYGDIDEEHIQEYISALNAFITDDRIDLYIDRFGKILTTLKYMKETAIKDVALSQTVFERCFEPETLMLLTMKVIMDNQASSIKKCGKTDTAFIEVEQYIKTLRELGVKDYDYAIKVYDEKQRKVVKYTFKDLLREYRKIDSSCKNTKYEIKGEQAEKLGLCRDYSKIDKFTELIKSEDERVLRAGWDFITPGERDITYDISKRQSSKGKGQKKYIDEDEILYRKFIFQQTNYLRQIVGKEKFEGYVGYVYENGLVIFEKFYEEGGKIAQIQATYVMNFRNFVEFSKLSKPEIIEYIKNTDNSDVDRLYHTDTWAERLVEVIEGVSPTMESQMFVETLEINGMKQKKMSNN